MGGRWGCPDRPVGGTEPIPRHPQRALFSEFGSCIPLYRHPCQPPLTPEGPPLFQIELLDTMALNLHCIDKDVPRCDRNYWYFTPPNLERLRDIMCRCHSGAGFRVGGGTLLGERLGLAGAPLLSLTLDRTGRSLPGAPSLPCPPPHPSSFFEVCHIAASARLLQEA